MDFQELKAAPADQIFEIDGQTVGRDDLLSRLKEQQLGVQQSIVRQRDDWVTYRAGTGVEDRWRRATTLYNGSEQSRGDFVDLLQNGQQPKKKDGMQANRSKVVVNIVRPKVDQAIARMCEILLPVDDRNYGIKPTPVPEMVTKMIGDMRPTVDPATGAPTGRTADEEAQIVVRQAKDAAEAMLEAIDDSLVECKYNAEQRAGISDGVRLGTMIMLGPFPAKKRIKSWQHVDGGRELNFNEEIQPASAHADPWDVWFDPSCGKDHQRGAGFWHRKLATKKELRALDGLPGYDSDAIREVLRTKPTRIRVASGRCNRAYAKEDAYELWTYHGDIEPDDMAMASMNTGDPLTDVEFGVVMLVNDTIIGAMPSWIVDKSLPCDVWNWREADDSPYGYGLPDELDHQQRVVTAAWRKVMDNSTASIGSQIVFRGGVAPVDGSMAINAGHKFWRADPDKIDDVTKAFHVFDFPSHLADLLTIAKTAMEMADAETSMPQILGGEKGSAPETVGGMVMLFNNANTVLRLRVKLYDDGITSPHVTRYYDWNMANNPDEKIKGDMEVDARGSTALLEKDIQNQATLNLSNITSNPRYAPYLDVKEELKAILKAFKMQPESVMASDEQIKKNLEAPPAEDPRVALERTKQEGNAADNEIKKQTLQYNAERERVEAELSQADMGLKREIAMATLAGKSADMNDDRVSNERLRMLELEQRAQLFNAEAALRVQTGQGI